MVATRQLQEPRRHLLTADDVLEMVRVGIIREGERIELIEGELIDMVPINPAHAGLVARLNRMIIRAAGDLGTLWTQSSVRLSDLNLPEPDFALLRYRADDYRERLPTADDIFLAVEVSHSSLRFDRNRKAPLYARLGIPELWIFDVEKDVVIRFQKPGPKGYRKVDEPRGIIAPALLPECAST
jgi:Uma2 family endonuclease